MNSASFPHLTAPANGPAGSLAADREQLIHDHLPLVSHVVRETMVRLPGHVSRDDLTSAGLMALVSASQSFDVARGVPFAGYAAPRIRGAILDELRRVDWASRSVRRTARSIEQTRNEMAVILGRVPSNGEIASTLGLDPEEITRNEEQTTRAQVLSLQASEELDLEGVLPTAGPTPEQVAEHQELLTYMVEAVAELPARLRTVVEQYFLAERPMVEIADELGVTESRVSQMRAEALVLLRGALNRELDPELEPRPAVDAPMGCAVRRREAYYSAVATRHAASLGGRGHLRRQLDEIA